MRSAANSVRLTRGAYQRTPIREIHDFFMASPRARHDRLVACVVEGAMNDVPNKSSSPILAAGGAAFLALAALFLVRDLAMPPETLLDAAALLAAVTAVLRPPRRVPWIGPAVLLAISVAGGCWFLAVESPALLPALALAAVGSIASVAMHERRASPSPSRLDDRTRRLAWYAAGVAFLVATGALYVHYFTFGFADESPARRLIPTIAWLA